MKVVLVDDSDARVTLIQSALRSSEFCKYIDVVVCDSADSARRELISTCDLLILDILIPKKTRGVPQSVNSVNLLSDICNPKKRYIRPGLIIGMTANVDAIGGYQEEFAKAATVVIKGTLADVSWLSDLMAHVESILGSKKKVLQTEKDRLLISVHGIRTYGQWQLNLGREISQHSRSFDFVEIKYGYFDLVSFIIPSLRKKKFEASAARLRMYLQNAVQREVYVVAHSFGTLIVSAALATYQPRDLIKGVILCGSPMRSNDNIDHIVNSSEITVNECGTRDLILVLARSFVLGLGDAGRVGFQRENAHNFMNRFFRSGHSAYFSKFDEVSTFYDRFWLRFIASDVYPERYDARKNFFGEDLLDLAVKTLGMLKPYVYWLAGAGLLALLFC